MMAVTSPIVGDEAFDALLGNWYQCEIGFWTEASSFVQAHFDTLYKVKGMTIL